MRRCFILWSQMSLVLLLCLGQSRGPLAGAMRPVKQLPTQRPSQAEIQFSSFEFLQLMITSHPGMLPIKGEPTKGSRFFVEAKLYGEEAIATANFEAVDQSGNVIQKILIERRPD